jgi:ABC-type glutathione transport system ATPase component
MSTAADTPDHSAVEMEVVTHSSNGAGSRPSFGEEESAGSDSPLYSCAVSDQSHQHSLSWQDICYEVDTYHGSVIKRKTGQKKRLLNNITGVVQPGTMIALMGPSGAGKSTALDVLAGRVKGSGLTGSLLLNGYPRPRSMKKFSAYVMQDDTLHGVLTVRENLYYSAMLRLPSSMSKEEKLGRVENIIKELGLGHVADTKIGNIFFRGVSGEWAVFVGVCLCVCLCV